MHPNKARNMAGNFEEKFLDRMRDANVPEEYEEDLEKALYLCRDINTTGQRLGVKMLTQLAVLIALEE